METDRLGRRRQPNQSEGLRPLHPVLPDGWSSRSVRVAMSAEDWERFETLVHALGRHEPTQARALGAALSQLMDAADLTPVSLSTSNAGHRSQADWMDWERQKTLKLIRWAG